MARWLFLSYKILRRLAAFFESTGTPPCQTREPQGLPPSGGKTLAISHVPRVPCAARPRSPGCRAAPCKNSQRFLARWLFLSYKILRRLAAFSNQLAQTPVRPASRKAFRRAAVVPRPNNFSTDPPRPQSAVWGAGALPLPARSFRPDRCRCNASCPYRRESACR